MPQPLSSEDALSTTSRDAPVALLGIEEVLNLLPVGRFHNRLLVMTGLAFMADAMEVSLLSFMATCAGIEWDLNLTQVASISSAVFFGELAGGCAFGPLADMRGRRLSFLVAVALISVGGIASGFAPNLPVLISFRVIVGAGVGGLTVPFDLLAEFLPISGRGQSLILIEFFWTLGSLFVAGMAWAFMDSLGWRGLTLITAFPVILTSATSFFMLPESPRWLLEQGRVKEAEEVLRAAAVINGTKLPPFHLAPLAKSSEEPAPLQTILAKLLDKTNRHVSIPLWVVWFAFGLSYYGIILFVPRVLSNNDGHSNDDDEPTCSFDYPDIFFNASFEIVGLIAATLAIDRAGRVRMQVAAYLITAVGVCMMGIDLSRMSVLGFGMLARAGAMAASSSTWVHTPELYGTELRATAHGACNVVARLGALLSPYLVSSSLSLATIGVALGATSAAAAGAATFLPETTGKGLEDTVEIVANPRDSESLSDDRTSILHSTICSDPNAPSVASI